MVASSQEVGLVDDMGPVVEPEVVISGDNGMCSSVEGAQDAERKVVGVVADQDVE